MLRRIASSSLALILVVGVLASACVIHLAKASGTIYIRADGSIDPPTASITTADNITYAFTGNVGDSIVVERDSIIVDGQGYAIQGTGSGAGVDLHYRNNVTIENIGITGFETGILLFRSSVNMVSGNYITENIICGVYLEESSSNTISKNNVVNYGNNIRMDYSSNNNVISENTIEQSSFYGIEFGWASNNKIYHNNFIDNNVQAYCFESSNVWNDGYPSGGNYWSDYSGVDLYYGPNQNITGSDGIGDTSYVLYTSNQDNYPLMNPWAPFENQTIRIKSDGSIAPSGAPIRRAGNLYTLTDDICSDSGGIEIERDDVTVDGAGYTLLGNSGPSYGWTGIDLAGRSKVTIRGITVISFMNEVWLDSSNGNYVVNNTLADGFCGIYLRSSEDNILANNLVARNFMGIFIFWHSTNNTVIGNTVAHQFAEGITLSSYCVNNSIIGNSIVNATTGIMQLDDSSGNMIYHNNFVDDWQNVYSYSSPGIPQCKNTWDNGCEGNFWSGYSGIDSDGDGVCDSPYVINADNMDHCPLMNPYWVPADVNHNLKVDILDVVRITGAYGATPASPFWNPHADIAQPFGKINIFDVVICTSHYGEKYP